MINQANPVSVLGELSLLGRKDNEPLTSGIIAELCAIKKELHRTAGPPVKTDDCDTDRSKRK